MHELESDRMGLIIVDWVSLEYNSNVRLQVIKFEGCSFCGENMTEM